MQGINIQILLICCLYVAKFCKVKCHHNFSFTCASYTQRRKLNEAESLERQKHYGQILVLLYPELVSEWCMAEK